MISVDKDSKCIVKLMKTLCNSSLQTAMFQDFRASKNLFKLKFFATCMFTVILVTSDGLLPLFV